MILSLKMNGIPIQKESPDKMWMFLLILSYEFMNYVLNEPDYKNRVAYHRAFVYSNHVPNLELFKIKAKALLKNLDKRL